MAGVKLDHVAIGLPRWEDAVELFEERLGGARLEIVYPMGPPDGFLHRFLANGGPRVHHATFKVPSLDDAIARAEAHGYGVVGVDRGDPHWQEAFLHPKQAQ